RDAQPSATRLRVLRGRPVRGGKHHHAAGAGNEPRRIETLQAPGAHVFEPRVPAALEPVIEPPRWEGMRTRNPAEVKLQLAGARFHLCGGDVHGYLFHVMARPSRISTMVETMPSLAKISRVYSRSPAVAASLSPRATAPPQSTLLARTRPPVRNFGSAMASAFGYSAFSPSRKTASSPASQRASASRPSPAGSKRQRSSRPALASHARARSRFSRSKSVSVTVLPGSSTRANQNAEYPNPLPTSKIRRALATSAYCASKV